MYTQLVLITLTCLHWSVCTLHVTLDKISRGPSWDNNTIRAHDVRTAGRDRLQVSASIVRPASRSIDRDSTQTTTRRRHDAESDEKRVEQQRGRACYASTKIRYSRAQNMGRTRDTTQNMRHDARKHENDKAEQSVGWEGESKTSVRRSPRTKTRKTGLTRFACFAYLNTTTLRSCIKS